MASKQDLATTESAASLAAKIRRKEVSPVEVIDAAIARIEAHNPKINALIILHLDGARTSAKVAVLPLLLAILVDRVANSLLATFYRVILLIPAVIPAR